MTLKTNQKIDLSVASAFEVTEFMGEGGRKIAGAERQLFFSLLPITQPCHFDWKNLSEAGILEGEIYPCHYTLRSLFRGLGTRNDNDFKEGRFQYSNIPPFHHSFIKS
nr:hypothetical protein [Bacteroidota bacterium]